VSFLSSARLSGGGFKPLSQLHVFFECGHSARFHYGRLKADRGRLSSFHVEDHNSIRRRLQLAVVISGNLEYDGLMHSIESLIAQQPNVSQHFREAFEYRHLTSFELMEDIDLMALMYEQYDTPDGRAAEAELNDRHGERNADDMYNLFSHRRDQETARNRREYLQAVGQGWAGL
jgi:hypothetical protein